MADPQLLWQCEKKLRARPDLRLDPNFPAMALDHDLAQRQADAAAFILSISVKAVEHAENFLGVFHIDPDAVIGDAENPLVFVLHRGDANLRHANARTIFDRIAYEIGEN